MVMEGVLSTIMGVLRRVKREKDIDECKVLEAS